LTIFIWVRKVDLLKDFVMKYEPRISNPEILVEQTLLPNISDIVMPQSLQERLKTPLEAHTALCNLAALAVSGRTVSMNGDRKKITSLPLPRDKTYRDSSPPSPNYSESLVSGEKIDRSLEDTSDWSFHVEAPGKLIRCIKDAGTSYEERSGLFYDGPEYTVFNTKFQQTDELIGPGFRLSAERKWFSPVGDANTKLDLAVRVSSESILDMSSRKVLWGVLKIDVDKEDRRNWCPGHRRRDRDLCGSDYTSIYSLVAEEDKELSDVDSSIVEAVAQSIINYAQETKPVSSQKLDKIGGVKLPVLA
jgi:hypothetical protein